MQVPILKQGPVLIATVQDALTDADLNRLRDDLLRQVGTHRSLGVVLDVTALDVLDSFAARMLRTMSQAVRMRGATTVIVGIQPSVAFTMVQLGLRLEEVETALDLEDGLRLIARRHPEAIARGFAGLLGLSGAELDE
jgi:rsbT antagonist protein RsbS